MAVLAAIATEGLTVSPPKRTNIDVLYAQVPPEIRPFIEWAGGELADKLTRDFIGWGYPPMDARKEALAAVGMLARRVFESVQVRRRFQP